MAIHDWIPGTELARDRWLAFPKMDRARLAVGIGLFLQEVHALDVTVAKECGVKEVDHEGEILELLDRLENPTASAIPDGLRSSMRACFRESLENGDPGEWAYQPALLHGDLSPGHVLVDQEGAITGIIDWGDVLMGDPARDFIFVYEDWGWEFLSLALDGYEKGGGGTGSKFLSRVLLRYLVDQLDWTLMAHSSGRTRDLDHGVKSLQQGVKDLRRSQEQGG